MSKIDELKTIKGLFLDKIPPKPQGLYIHFVLLRETESFPVFQTDGTLNIIPVQAGLANSDTISRLVMFKRKQSSPERLIGRELLRFYGLISDNDKERSCEYNSVKFCKKCPDCIFYGYAIGDKGSEKSKVLVDSAFSVTPYEDSHKSFSFNALYEHGTMSEAGKTRPHFGEQDHVVPQVFFPAIVTLRDSTYEGFIYVLGNILRTDRYGAQETRTGKVFNHVVALTFTNGEIFSNLRFSQAVYDNLKNQNKINPPLDKVNTLKSATSAYKNLIKKEPLVVLKEIIDDDLTELLNDVNTIYQDGEKTKAFLSSLYKDTETYAKEHGALKKKKKGKEEPDEESEEEEEG